MVTIRNVFTKFRRSSEPCEQFQYQTLGFRKLIRIDRVVNQGLEQVLPEITTQVLCAIVYDLY